MASRHRIAETINESRMGDVEKFFDELSAVIETNSGTHDFKIISSDCHAQSAPLYADGFTKFNLTETALDIVDISKGYINMNIEFDVKYMFNGTDLVSPDYFDEVNPFNKLTFFIGFKSGAHIINVFNVYSNGRLTSCQNSKAKYEQMITYNSKAKEEKISRPGLYSPHAKVMEMSDCVCGTYFSIPLNQDILTSKTIHLGMDVCIQVDDLLPFSAMSYYPRFLCGDLELELSPNLVQNMVFCPIPHDVALEMLNYKVSSTDAAAYAANISEIKRGTDYRFTQCGDYAQCAIVNHGETDYSYVGPEITLIPSNLCVRTAKSYVHGFNIKSEAMQHIAQKFSSQNLVIPAQWTEWHALSQLPGTSQIKANIHVPMSNASQLIFTFPNTSNQLTVTRNPHLEAVQCHVNDRVIPDKFFTTLDNSHSEMILTALGMDTLFSAADELIESLTRDRKTYKTWTLKKKDDSDYMLIFNLERFGSGCFCDGMSGTNVPINLDANYLHSTENPHYYKMEPDTSKTFHSHNINLIVLSDAFWVCGPNGCEFIKN